MWGNFFVMLDFTVPPEFEKCAKEYRSYDHKYIDCPIGPGDDRCELLKLLHEAKDFRTKYFIYVPIILSSFALLLNLLFFAMCVPLVFRSRKGSRKRYAFLLNRCVSTLISLGLFFFVLVYWKVGHLDYYSAAIFLVVGIGQFLTLTGTYLAITSLIYTAVVHPLFYRTRITMFRCILLIALIWAFSFSSSMIFGIFGATLFYPDTTPIKFCTYDHCQWPLALALVIFLSATYLLVIIFYAIMFARMKWRQRHRVTPVFVSDEVPKISAINNTLSNTNSMTSSLILQRNIRSMNRLSLNLITFAVCKSPFVVVCILALLQLSELKKLGEGEKTACKTFLKAKLFLEMEILASIAVIAWIMGMILDPLINLIFDPNFFEWVTQGAKQMNHIMGTITYSRNKEEDGVIRAYDN